MKSDILLAIDIDGTLLRTDGSLSNNTIDFLNNWSGIIVFVSGRNEVDFLRFIDQNSLICDNRYVIIDDGQYIGRLGPNNSIDLLCENPYLKKSDVDFLSDWAKRRNLSWVIYHDFDTCSIVNCSLIKYLVLRVFSIFGNRVCIRYRKPGKSDKIDVIKLSINGFGNKTINDVYNGLTLELKDELYAVINDNMIEIKNQKSSKLNSLRWLTDYLSFNDYDCYYFGNGGNDVECLSFYTNSYAVENACPEAKAAASELIPSNDNDGVLIKLNEIMELLK